MVQVQVLKVVTEVKDGAWRYRLVTKIILNARPSRCRKNQPRCAADVERYGRGKARCRGSKARRSGSEERGARSKVFVIS